MKDPARYIRTVVELDFERPLDELVALVFLACGKPPPIKPYAAVSHWKQAATDILLASVPGAKRADVMRYVHHVTLIALNHARGRGLGSPGQQYSYAMAIKGARRAWV